MSRDPTGKSSTPILIGGSIVVLFILFATVSFWFFSSAPIAQPGTEGQGLGEKFLEHVRLNQMDAAWEMTSPEFRSFMGRESFQKMVRSHPELREKPQFQERKPTKINGLDRVEFSYSFPKSGKKIRLVMAPDQGQFKIEHWEWQ